MSQEENPYTQAASKDQKLFKKKFATKRWFLQKDQQFIHEF